VLSTERRPRPVIQLKIKPSKIVLSTEGRPRPLIQLRKGLPFDLKKQCILQREGLGLSDNLEKASPV
jgi:hypothetical protein